MLFQSNVLHSIMVSALTPAASFIIDFDNLDGYGKQCSLLSKQCTLGISPIELASSPPSISRHHWQYAHSNLPTIFHPLRSFDLNVHDPGS